MGEYAIQGLGIIYRLYRDYNRGHLTFPYSILTACKVSKVTFRLLECRPRLLGLRQPQNSWELNKLRLKVARSKRLAKKGTPVSISSHMGAGPNSCVWSVRGLA